jgi:hypothetical protein
VSWARANTLISAVAGSRVARGEIKGAPYPQLWVTRVGGAPNFDGIPYDAALIQLDCWGAETSTTTSGETSAALLATAVLNAVRLFKDGTPMGADAVGMWATVTGGPSWLPDTETGQARYTITAEFGVRSA